jgi:hypothetical protein
MAAYFADRPAEVLETARRLTYVIEAELDAIEENSETVISTVPEYRRKQIEVIRGAVSDVAQRHELSATSVDEVVTRLDELRERAEEMAAG